MSNPMAGALSCIVVCGLLTGVAQGDLLVPESDNWQWDLRQDPSPIFVVEVASTAEGEDLLLWWELELTLSPTVNSTGEVIFDSAVHPPGYLLEGRSGGLDVGGLSSPEIEVGDTDSSFAGVVVPGSGIGLLGLRFTASADASGEFELRMLASTSDPGDDTGSFWFSADFEKRPFINVPFGGTSAVITTISLIPEPTSAMLASVGFIWCLARRRKT